MLELCKVGFCYDKILISQLIILFYLLNAGILKNYLRLLLRYFRCSMFDDWKGSAGTQ